MRPAECLIEACEFSLRNATSHLSERTAMESRCKFGGLNGGLMSPKFSDEKIFLDQRLAQAYPFLVPRYECEPSKKSVGDLASLGNTDRRTDQSRRP